LCRISSLSWCLILLDVYGYAICKVRLKAENLDSARVWWCQLTWIHPGFVEVISPGFTQGLVVSAHLNSPKVWWCQLTWIYPGLGDVSVLFILVFLAMLCFVLLVFVPCIVSPTLSVLLDCLFLITPSVFSNVFYLQFSCI
jgi:hypothetical protein